jgi:hypothetical protein
VAYLWALLDREGYASDIERNPYFRLRRPDLYAQLVHDHGASLP